MMELPHLAVAAACFAMVGYLGYCHPSPGPVAPIPDASDAALVMEGAPAPTSIVSKACRDACRDMNAVHCDQMATCEGALQTAETLRIIVDPSKRDGGDNALTCQALVGVSSPAAVIAHGWGCPALDGGQAMVRLRP